MTTDEPAAEPAPVEEPYLGFFLGAELYGLPLHRLREVSRLSSLRRLPGAAAHVAGLVNVHGEIICALDSRAILGLAPAPAGPPGYLIALRDFDYPVGLVVDAIADIFAIDPATIVAPPEAWQAARAACCLGMTSVQAGPIGLLDLDLVVKR